MRHGCTPPSGRARCRPSRSATSRARSPRPRSRCRPACASACRHRSFHVVLTSEIPRYVAIITDGNGRWAQSRGVQTVDGHQAGADAVKARLRDAAELGVDELTVYSFSTENWGRPEEEVAGLMNMFSQRIIGETP